jgi:hypothetical protein
MEINNIDALLYFERSGIWGSYQEGGFLGNCMREMVIKSVSNGNNQSLLLKHTVRMVR